MPSHSERVRRNYDSGKPAAESSLKDKKPKDSAHDRPAADAETPRLPPRKPAGGSS
jgi:hypothetical protein